MARMKSAAVAAALAVSVSAAAAQAPLMVAIDGGAYPGTF